MFILFVFVDFPPSPDESDTKKSDSETSASTSVRISIYRTAVRSSEAETSVDEIPKNVILFVLLKTRYRRNNIQHCCSFFWSQVFWQRYTETTYCCSFFGGQNAETTYCCLLLKRQDTKKTFCCSFLWNWVFGRRDTKKTLCRSFFWSARYRNNILLFVFLKPGHRNNVLLFVLLRPSHLTTIYRKKCPAVRSFDDKKKRNKTDCADSTRDTSSVSTAVDHPADNKRYKRIVCQKSGSDDEWTEKECRRSSDHDEWTENGDVEPSDDDACTEWKGRKTIESKARKPSVRSKWPEEDLDILRKEWQKLLLNDELPLWPDVYKLVKKYPHLRSRSKEQIKARFVYLKNTGY
jgi:hypothetical protein